MPALTTPSNAGPLPQVFVVLMVYPDRDESLEWRADSGFAWPTLELAIAEAQRQAQAFVKNDFCDDEEKGVTLTEYGDPVNGTFRIAVCSDYRGLPEFQVRPLTLVAKP